MEHVQHGVAVAGAQIADEESALGLKLSQRRHVALGQVHHMNIIPDAGAVGGIVVVAIDVELFQLAHRHLGDIGHQVVGDAVGVLADQAALMGADGIEIPQQGHIQRGVCCAVIGENALLEELGGAVGIGGAAGGEILPDGHGGRVAVHRGGGGKHKVLHTVGPHGLEQVQRADQVVGIVLQRFADALSHGLEPGEVHHGVNLRVLGKEGLHLLQIAQLRLDKGDLLPHDLLHPADRLLTGVIKIVRHNDIIARLDQLHAGVAADIPRAAGDKNGHKNRSFQNYKNFSCPRKIFLIH